MQKSDLLKELRIDRGTASPESRKLLWSLLGGVALLAVGAVAWSTLSGASELPVRTTLARPAAGAAANASVLDATGYVTARRAATVSAQISGALTEVLIEEGEYVNSGQVLARLDDTAQKAALAQAQAQAQAAQALLVQYQVQLAQSRRDLQRIQEIAGRKLVSQQATEQAQTLVETHTSQVAVQHKQLKRALAAIQSAQVQLDYCTVRAPFAGVVIAKSAQVGEIISPFSAGGGFTRTGVATIVDMDSLEIEVDVNEAYINRVVVGHPVESVLNAYPDWKISSHVIAIIPTADRSKATVKVRIGLDTKDARIVPDMGVHVSFLEESKPAAQARQTSPGVLVPATALYKDAEQDIVYVLVDQKAQRRAVTLGENIGEAYQVLRGVNVGERVITDAPAEIKDGSAVTLASP